MILASAQYQSGSLALFITFDENDNQAVNQVPDDSHRTLVPPGERVADAFTHYSIATPTETLLKVPLLGGAKTRRSMIAPFLCSKRRTILTRASCPLHRGTIGVR